MRLFTILAIAIIILTSCQNNKRSSGISVFEEMMALKIEEANTYARELSESGNSVHKNNFKKSFVDYELLPLELTYKYDVHFYGSVEKLLRSLATELNFDIRVLGNAPAVPIDIYINDKDERLVDILMHLGAQLSSNNSIILNVDLGIDSFNVDLVFGVQ